MKKIALFPGTFDPFTNGHLDIVHRGLAMFDEVIVAIGVNSTKKHLFDLEQRLLFIKEVFQDEPRVRVTQYSGLTAPFAEANGAKFLLRGLRTTQDFTYEQQIAYVNEEITTEVQSVFVISNQENASVSSTIVRDLIRHKGPVEKYIPASIYRRIQES